MKRIVVIGAGIGGLTAAAVLARAGLDVTVLEAHVYPGGCAGTFYHQGYRFDAGATLAAGFYPGGPMDLVEQAAGKLDIEAQPSNPAMMAHLPNGKTVFRWTDDRRLQEYVEKFGAEAEGFWRWQEQAADAMWDLALRQPSWMPQSLAQTIDLAGKGMSWLAANSSHRQPGLWLDAFRPVATHLRGMPDDLRLFIDGQLLISAQTTSKWANALYGASALDLPRRGSVHIRGGMGAIAKALAGRVTANQGKVIYRQEATAIFEEKGGGYRVHTNKGNVFEADLLIANLPPWNIAQLLKSQLPPILRNLPERPRHGWGAFMVYVGLDGSLLPEDYPSHHQIIVKEPLGEGNSLFLSFSPHWDASRAPQGKRALTISTHTDLSSWWESFENDHDAYEARKKAYTNRLMQAIERILPGFCDAAYLIMPGTPVSFHRFTRRAWGWVGGFPQTNLFRSLPPRLSKRLWMVGDSIFPGQSVAATALGGLRVAGNVIAMLKI